MTACLQPDVDLRLPHNHLKNIGYFKRGTSLNERESWRELLLQVGVKNKIRSRDWFCREPPEANNTLTRRALRAILS
jgi:hypothetical protein